MAAVEAALEAEAVVVGADGDDSIALITTQLVSHSWSRYGLRPVVKSAPEFGHGRSCRGHCVDALQNTNDGQSREPLRDLAICVGHDTLIP